MSILSLKILALITSFVTVYPSISTSCDFLSDDSKHKGLEERALDAEVVLSAYTRTVYQSRTPKSNSYEAEFLVFNIIKGESHLKEIYSRSRPSALETALSRRLVNVSNFGDPMKCEADVRAGETYVLLLDVANSGDLVARYDGAYGPAVVYSKDKELALEAIGSSPWSEWSPCSGSCGGGIQQRKRLCDGNTKCSENDGQQRTCNMFSCTSTMNVLEASGVHRSSIRPAGRPTAYRLLPTGSWRSRKEEIVFPRTFPWEFSLLVTIRAKPTSSGGFLLRVLHSDSLQVGLYIGDILTLVLSDKHNIRVSFVKSLFDDQWHQLAFSVRRNTVSFYLNCEFSGRLPVSGKIMPFGGQTATLVVGSTGEHELDAFQGDVEQLTITGNPDSAERQCNSTTQPLVIRSDKYALHQESNSRAQNDQLPLRGVDDEDFIFEDKGSGDKSHEDDEDYEDYDIDKIKKDSDTKDKKIPLKAENNEVGVDYDDDDKDDITNPFIPEVKTPEKSTLKKDSAAFLSAIKTTTEKSTTELTKLKVKPVAFTYFSNATSRTYITTPRPAATGSSDAYHVDEETDYDDYSEGSGDSNRIELGWSDWSPCSTTCNWGRRTRTSYCLDNGRDLESCTALSSKRTETEACFMRICQSTTLMPRSLYSTQLPAFNLTGVLIKPECRVRCLHGGKCYGKFRCLCTRGFYGSLCQYAKNTCRVSCINGGVCRPPSTCICPKGYSGDECQYATCKQRCLNGGACIAPNRCRCKPGYAGDTCHKAVCEGGCKNGADCVAPNKCNCRSGFTGADCSQPSCEPTCQNGGKCIKPYFCNCPPGTKGNLCEKFICKPECLNGGLCVGANKCSCSKGYVGAYCEQLHCPGKCFNGGKCGKTGKCLCPVGYSGVRCESKKACKYVEVKEPFKRGYKQKVVTQAKVPCGAWNWKMCTKTKVHYEMVYKTFYKTSYECEGKYSEYERLKNE